MQTLVDNWVRVLTRLYIPILVLVFAASYYSFTLAKQLKLNANIISLMPDGVPSVDNLQKVIKKTGGYSNAMVVVESPDVEAATRYLEDLRSKVLEQEWVSSSEYKEDTAVFQRNKLIYVGVDDLKEMDKRLARRLDYEKKNIKFQIEETDVEINIRGGQDAVPPLLFKDIENKYAKKNSRIKSTKFFRNKAGNISILVVLPKGGTTNVNYARQIIADMRALIPQLDTASYHPELKVSLGGRVTNLVKKVESIVGDVQGSALWAISGILLVVMLYYRRFMALFYIGVPLAVGFLWTFAVAQLTLGGLNLMTIFLVVILFGLGIDFGIHNLARYDEVRKGGGDMNAALRIVYSRTGKASLWAGITTIAGFFSLMLTDFKAFYEFGFIAGSGVALTLLSMYLVFPALMVLAERVRIYRVPRWGYKQKEKNGKPFPFANTIVVVAALLTIGAGTLLPGLEFESDFGNLKTRVPELAPINDKIHEVFPLRSDKAVLFVEELEDVAPLVDEIERIRKQRPADDASIEKVSSIYSVVPRTEDQEQRLAVIDRIHQQLLEAKELLEDFSNPQDPRKKDIEDMLDHFGVSQLKAEDLPPAIQRVYTGTSGSGYLVYIYNSKGVSKFEDATAFVEDIREITANGKKFYPATEAIVFVDMLNLMKKDASKAVILVLVAVTISLLIAFRDVRYTVVAVVPVVLGVVWMLGIMVAVGAKLNIFNMVVLPTVLGIGVDNGIHIFHRYREEGDRISHVIRTTGGAAFLTTLTTILGFAGTLTASNLGLQSLGLAACIGLGCCMVTSLTVFPAVLQLVEDWKRNRTAA